jgi:hypothetical protein
MHISECDTVHVICAHTGHLEQKAVPYYPARAYVGTHDREIQRSGLEPDLEIIVTFRRKPEAPDLFRPIRNI